MLGHLVGLAGYAGSGKRTLAGIARQALGCVSVSFQEALYNLAIDINPIIWIHRIIPVRLRWLVVRCGGWDGALKHKQVFLYVANLHSFLQARLGSRVLIHALDARVAAIRETGRSVMVANIQAVEEAEWVRDAGGFVVRIHRGDPLVAQSEYDPSDVFPFCEVTLNNTGGLDALTESCNSLRLYIDQRAIAMQTISPYELSVYTGDDEVDAASMVDNVSTEIVK